VTTGGFPQFSGLRWAWNPRFATNDTTTAAPNGITAYVSVRDPLTGEWAAIEPQRVYKIATLNFMFTKGAGDGYVIGPTIAYDAFGPPDVDAVAAWMSSPQFVAPPSLATMRACGNTSYVLEDPGHGSVAWPAPQCNIIRAQEPAVPSASSSSTAADGTSGSTAAGPSSSSTAADGTAGGSTGEPGAPSSSSTASDYNSAATPTHPHWATATLQLAWRSAPIMLLCFWTAGL
jgi:hypothetical protein